MSDQYGPHSSGNILVDGKTAEPFIEGEYCYFDPRPVDPLLYTQAQVDALVAAERERCANVAVQMDRAHRMYTLACVEIAAAIRSGAVNLPAEDTE